jgi:transcriptional regulator with XRE-family HTH domain
LRRLRAEKQLTIEEVADKAAISKSTVSRIENTQVGVAIPVLRELLRVFEVDEAQRESLEELAKEASKRGWWQTAGGDLSTRTWKTLVGLESGASHIHSFASVVVSGLLQTPAYATALIRSGDREASKDSVDMLVGLRMRRQERLGQMDYWAILAEEVLHRTVGGPKAMAEQLQHLVELADHPRNTIQVLPFRSGEHPGLRGPFTVLDIDPASGLSAVYLEGNRTEVMLELPSEVEPFKRDFSRLTAQALSPDESIQLITTLQEGLRP